ncbi:hypothetical protein B296_00001160 [Ensete ventricosum]|uniref:Uncharacterized protein n=1 Tax=Ensete ventricosum TaxID=4639 RepID=A0A427AZB1_ENSVE|nr:hypothetical protein B296_00001160 [Ensete ventricosum]
MVLEPSKHSEARGQPTMAKPSAGMVGHAYGQATEAVPRRGGACGHDAHRQAAFAARPPANATARRSARRGSAHRGATRGRSVGCKGSSVRPLVGWLSAGKGSRRLYRGSGDGAVRVKEER